MAAAILAGLAGPAGTRAAVQTPTWVTTSGKVVHLTLIAGWNNVNDGFNFDGAAHGQMVVTIPLGDTVDATFKNNASGAMHDAVIVPYQKTLPGTGSKPAFAGASSPVPQFRPGATRPVAGVAEPFSFVASKAGTYMIICGISGHALAGMWDTLVVSASATSASVAFNAAGVTTASAASAPPATAPTWVTTKDKVVDLSLVAGWNNANDGFNFDGGAQGKMTVTVPLGSKVVATFKNDTTIPHDVLVIPYMSTLPSHSVTPAFTGARSSFSGAGRPGAGGPSAGGSSRPRTPGPTTFTFVANKAGTYMIICGVPGHALAGMWDKFVVSSTATVASVTYTS
jgi:sulfocyanin